MAVEFSDSWHGRFRKFLHRIHSYISGEKSADLSKESTDALFDGDLLEAARKDYQSKIEAFNHSFGGITELMYRGNKRGHTNSEEERRRMAQELQNHR